MYHKSKGIVLAVYSALDKNSNDSPTVKPGNFRNEWLRNRTGRNLSYIFNVGKWPCLVARLIRASFS